ncbi:MAG TPA: hypothetical protein VK992_07405 [Candidatus Caenarcaniphilales bacterium]|nr:hypothetical protein [Candidatus Caenarcaniphilales bacterium]
MSGLTRALVSATEHCYRRSFFATFLATPEFRRAAFESRGSAYDIPRKTSDPERALENLLERDRLFTEDVAREAAALRLPVIGVDVGMSINELAARVSEALDLP